MNLDGGLVVGRRGVHLGLARRDRRVAIDHLGHDATHGLDAQRKRGHIEQQDALDVTAEHAALDSRANGNDLVRVDAHVRILARDLLDFLLDSRHTGGATNEDDLVNLSAGKASVLHRGLDRRLATLEQVCGDALELGTRQRVVQMDRVAVDSRDERQVDSRLLRVGELHLCLLGSFLEALQSHLVLAQVHALIGLELVCQPIDDALIPVIATQVVVACGRENLEDAIAHLEDGNVKGTTAEVEDEDLLVDALLVKAVSQRCCGRLVDDALDLEAGDLASVLGCLTLCVVEVSRNGDDSLGHRLAQVLLGVSLELLEHHGRNLLGRVVMPVDLHHVTAVLALDDVIGDSRALGLGLIIVATDEALDRRNGVLGVGNSLVLCCLADDALAILAETDNGRSGAITFRVDDNRGLAALENRHGRVGRAKVNTNNLAHIYAFLHVELRIYLH